MKISLDILESNENTVIYARKKDPKLLIRLMTGENPVFVPEECDIILRMKPSARDMVIDAEELTCFSPEDDTVYVEIPEEILDIPDEWESSVLIMNDGGFNGGVKTPPFSIVTG